MVFCLTRRRRRGFSKCLAYGIGLNSFQTIVQNIHRIRSRVAYRFTRAALPAINASTSDRVAIVVSPGVVIANAP